MRNFQAIRLFEEVLCASAYHIAICSNAASERARMGWGGPATSNYIKGKGTTRRRHRRAREKGARITDGSYRYVDRCDLYRRSRPIRRKVPFTRPPTT